MTREVVRIDDCVISRSLIGRPELRSEILLRCKHGQDFANDLRGEKILCEVQLLRKIIQEVTELKQRIALLIELKDGPVFGLSIGKV